MRGRAPIHKAKTQIGVSKKIPAVTSETPQGGGISKLTRMPFRESYIRKGSRSSGRSR